MRHLVARTAKPTGVRVARRVPADPGFPMRPQGIPTAPPCPAQGCAETLNGDFRCSVRTTEVVVLFSSGVTSSHVASDPCIAMVESRLTTMHAFRVTRGTLRIRRSRPKNGGKGLSACERTVSHTSWTRHHQRPPWRKQISSNGVRVAQRRRAALRNDIVYGA